MRSTRAIRRAATFLLPLSLLGLPGVARAHATVDHADPKVGATVIAPTQVRIWFDHELDPASSSVTVHGPDGATAGDGHGQVDRSDPRLLKTDVPHLVPGTYQVAWSVTSRDGHRTSGDYRFTVK